MPLGTYKSRDDTSEVQITFVVVLQNFHSLPISKLKLNLMEIRNYIARLHVRLALHAWFVLRRTTTDYRKFVNQDGLKQWLENRCFVWLSILSGFLCSWRAFIRIQFPTNEIYPWDPVNDENFHSPPLDDILSLSFPFLSPSLGKKVSYDFKFSFYLSMIFLS